jgi:hypothetical protein
VLLLAQQEAVAQQAAVARRQEAVARRQEAVARRLQEAALVEQEPLVEHWVAAALELEPWSLVLAPLAVHPHCPCLTNSEAIVSEVPAGWEVLPAGHQVDSTSNLVHVVPAIFASLADQLAPVRVEAE